jgi:5-carboxymethyl-2-hydroxymuconate isomerase
MPQITLEHSKNLKLNDTSKLLLGIHQILAENLPTDIESCKSRIITHNNFLVGTNPENAFLYLSIHILPGRIDEVINKTTNILSNYLKQNIPLLPSCQISVGIDMLPTSYQKIAM